MPLRDGTQAPDFTLFNAEGKSFTLSEDAAKSPVLLFFYPGDFTIICTKQACTMRDSYEFFLNLGIKVIGIGVDSPETHRKFKSQYRLPFELLSDPGRTVAKTYGSLWPIINRTKRISYLLGPDHKIVTSHHNEWAPESHLRHLVQILVEGELHHSWSESIYLPETGK
jgi:peroxiredoxin Q/BCP